MKVDRLTQTLLALIALALFMNALNPWLLPQPAFAAQAPPANLPMMEVHLRNIDNYLQGMDLRNLGRSMAEIGRSLAEIEGDAGRIELVICGISDLC